MRGWGWGPNSRAWSTLGQSSCGWSSPTRLEPPSSFKVVVSGVQAESLTSRGPRRNRTTPSVGGQALGAPTLDLTCFSSPSLSKESIAILFPWAQGLKLQTLLEQGRALDLRNAPASPTTQQRAFLFYVRSLRARLFVRTLAPCGQRVLHPGLRELVLRRSAAQGVGG